jgi:hypothetical protein
MRLPDNVLRPPEMCDHGSGITMTHHELRCSDCHAEMVFVTKREWERKSIPGENERELQRLLNTRTSALVRISQYLREVGIG